MKKEHDILWKMLNETPENQILHFNKKARPKWEYGLSS